MTDIVITGHSGYIGSQLTAELLSRGYHVTGISRHSRLEDRENLTQLHIDLQDPGNLHSLFSSHHIKILIHLAWYTTGHYTTDSQNLDLSAAFLTMLRLFEEHGGTRLICAGSNQEYDPASMLASENMQASHCISLYGTCKRALGEIAREFCALHRISYCQPRIFFSYGPGEKAQRLVPSVIRSCLANQPIAVSDCRVAQDYLYIKDVAAALADVAESDVQGPINISSGQAIPLRQLVERIVELSDNHPPIEWGAIPAKFDYASLAGDNHKLRALGWSQRYTLDEGLRESIAYWQQREHLSPVSGGG